MNSTTPTAGNDDNWLAALDEDEPTYWRPEQEGDTVTGVVRETYEDRGNYGPYTVLVLKTDTDGLVKVRADVAVLRRKVEELRPRRGDELGVRYMGPQTSSSGRTYQGFRVAHKRPDPPMDLLADEPPSEEEVEFDPTVEDPWGGSVA